MKVAAAVAEYKAAVAKLEATKSANPEAANRKMLMALRPLTEINYTIGSKFQHDAAVPAKPVPGLQPAANLAAMDANSDAYKFLRADMVRQLNRIQFAFRQAAQALS